MMPRACKAEPLGRMLHHLPEESMALVHDRHVLAINAGSSSIKFALFKSGPARELVFRGAISDIGSTRSRFAASGRPGDTHWRGPGSAGQA